MLQNAPEKWKIKPLSEVAKIKGGKRVPKGEKLVFENTGYPYIRVADFTDDGTVDLSDIRYVTEDVFKQIKNYTINSADLYISIAGTIGKAGIVPKELSGANLTENSCKLVFENTVFNRYAYYFTQTEYFLEQAGLNTRVAAMPKLALSRLGTIKLPFPPIPEQKRIVAILDQAFTDIEQARTKTEKNLKNARELFESYLQQVFSQHGEVSLKLGEIVEVLTDYHANGSYKVLKQHVELKAQEDFAWMVRSTDFEKKFKNDKRYISEHAYNYLTKSKLFGGEIIMSKIGNAGKVYFMPETNRACSLAMNLFLIRLDSSKANNEYVYRYLNSSSGKAQIAPRLKGAATQTITKDNVRSLLIPLPSLENQQNAVEKLKKLEKEIETLEALYVSKLSNIEELKKSILQKAFSGELTKTPESDTNKGAAA